MWLNAHQEPEDNSTFGTVRFLVFNRATKCCRNEAYRGMVGKTCASMCFGAAMALFVKSRLLWFIGLPDYLGYHTNNNNIECFKWAERNWLTCDIFPIGYHLNRCNKSIEHVIS